MNADRMAHREDFLLKYIEYYLFFVNMVIKYGMLE